MEQVIAAGAVAGEIPGTSSQSAKGRVLVVEDELVVAMLVEDMVVEAGYEVAAVASHLDDALALTDSTVFDFAILDVHLNGRPVFPLADALMERGLPFVFATAYGPRGLPEKYRNCPVLQKPFYYAQLLRALSRLDELRAARAGSQK